MNTFVILAAAWLLVACGSSGPDRYTGGDIITVCSGNATCISTDGSGNTVDSPCSNQQYRDQSGDPSCNNSPSPNSNNGSGNTNTSPTPSPTPTG